MQNPMIEKLRKLIAHERSARNIGNLHEAEAFADKIQDLLTTHKLSMSEVDFQAREAGEPIDWEHVSGEEVSGGRITKTFWRQRLACTLAEINSCMVVNTSKTAFAFVGKTSDRQIAKILFVYLVDLGEELCAKSDRENREEQREAFLEELRATLAAKFGTPIYYEPQWTDKAFNKHMKDYRESWKVGYSKAIHERLWARYQEMLKAQATTSANAIVHVKRDALAVQAHLSNTGFHSRRQQFKINTASADGFRAGQSTGAAVNLSPHTFGTAGRGSRLLGS